MDNGRAIDMMKYNREILGTSDQGNHWKPNASTIACDMAINALQNNETSHWISVTDKLPNAEERVLVCTETHCVDGRKYKHITVGMYEDGNMWREDSSWDFNDFDNLDIYDKEHDDYRIPEGWWEYTIYNDEEGNYPIDDFVTHWMPLPETPKEKESAD